MNKEEIEQEAGILDLAVRQLALELSNGGVRVSKAVLKRLNLIVHKLDQLEKEADRINKEVTDKDAKSSTD